MTIKELADQYEPYIIEKRRFFHQIPELSFEEKETTAAIVEELKGMDVDEIVTYPDYTGCVAIIKGAKPGPTVLIRADIDALAVNEHTGLPFASRHEGRMHACGHDNHIAMLLGAVKILTQKKDEIAGSVKCLFQAAEETCWGSRYYIDHGILDGVAGAMGMHIWNDLEVPYINFQSGNRMASAAVFKITVNGVSCHGSAPQNGRDAVIAAASILMNLQTYVSRRNSPFNPLVISVGQIHGGEAYNVVANKVVMDGTLRTYSKELAETVEQELRTIIESAAACLGCTAELDYTHYLSPVINDHEDLVRIARGAVAKNYGEESLHDMHSVMGAEDFANFMDVVPGVFGFIGSHNEEKGTIYGNHNDHYNVDEDMLKKGAATYAQFAVDFLHEKAASV